MRDKRVKQVIDTGLSSLRMSEQEMTLLTLSAQGGKKVKKKLSMAFIMAMVLVTIAVTALAVVTIRELGKQVALNQKEKGYFGNWSPEQKTKLIRELVELKYLEATEDVNTLLTEEVNEAETGALADKVMSTYTGQEAKFLEFLGIMQTAMGPFDQWSYEEKAWYSQLMRDVGLEGEDVTFFVEPTGKISKEQAVAIARREVAAGYGVPESQLDRYEVKTNFQIPEANEPDDRQAYWYVGFTAPDDMPENERLFIVFPVYVHPETGELLWSVESMRNMGSQYSRPDNELYRLIGSIEAEAEKSGHYSFRVWPIELKARWTKEVTPLVKQLVASDDLSSITIDGRPDTEVLAQSHYLYGLPGDSDISQAEAYTNAKAALQKAYGIQNEEFALYRDEIVFFDITDPEKPLWRFLFNAGSVNWPELKDSIRPEIKETNYRVAINARSGAVEYMEKFNFEPLSHDYDYRLKFQ